MIPVQRIVAFARYGCILVASDNKRYNIMEIGTKVMNINKVLSDPAGTRWTVMSLQESSFDGYYSPAFVALSPHRKVTKKLPGFFIEGRNLKEVLIELQNDFVELK